MTASGAALSVRRILVALDASGHSRAALETAAQLASWHEAELEGLYVEDINLIRMATLPTTREVGPASPTPRPLVPRHVERVLRETAAGAERALTEIAKRRGVRARFRVARGAVTSVLLEAAGEADVVALGRAGAGTRGPGRLGSTARQFAARRSHSTLLLQGRLRPDQSVVVFFDGSPSCERAIAAAAGIANRLRADLRVVVPASDPERGRQLETAAAKVLGAVPGDVRARTLVGTDRPAMLRAVRSERPGLCVVGCGSGLGDELVNRLADELRVSLFLVQ